MRGFTGGVKTTTPKYRARQALGRKALRQEAETRLNCGPHRRVTAKAAEVRAPFGVEDLRPAEHAESAVHDHRPLPQSLHRDLRFQPRVKPRLVFFVIARSLRLANAGITKAGNALARRALIEGAWTYRMQPRVSRKLHDRIEALPQVVRDIGWKAQVRLCARYRRLAAAGKPKVVVTTAIAREMLGFVWAIARSVQAAPLRTV